jgi:hypothetical protein
VGHDAVGFGHFDAGTETVRWPEAGSRGSSFHEALVDETTLDGQ